MILTPIKTHTRLTALEYMLNAKALEPEMPYFFYAEANTGYDEGCSFCKRCILSIVPDARIGEHYGGGYCFDSDGCVYCEECGVMLEYALTHEGVNEELYIWEETPPREPIDGENCYRLACIAGELHTIEQKAKFLKLFRGINLVEQAS